MAKYEITKGGKKYKKYLLTKKFREDAEGKGKRIPKAEKEKLQAKLMELYQSQAAKQEEEEKKEGAASSDEKKDPLAVIQELDEAYLSDLKPEDIPDDCVSEPDMQSLENNTGEISETAKSNLLTAQADIDARAEEENRKFLTDFVKLYQEDPL